MQGLQRQGRVGFYGAATGQEAVNVGRRPRDVARTTGSSPAFGSSSWRSFGGTLW